MKQQSQQIVYIHSDQPNTSRMATDQNQTTVWQWHSSAFGEEWLLNLLLLTGRTLLRTLK